jgi:LPS-assembly lipoprotein
MYARGADGGSGAAAQGLAQIAVGIIPERSGQLLRQALQERFERSGLGTARRYDLTVSYSVSSEGIAIDPDTNNTRVRFVGSANFSLVAQDPSRATLFSGTARSVDGINEFDNQYFAADMETATVQRRMAEAVADQIALQLAAFFNRRAASGSGGAG